jgi:trehalose 6-phosphate synthase
MVARIRFFVVLVFALGLLSATAWLLVTQTTRGWFERDLALRADLAVSGARRALVSDLQRKDVRGLRNLLAEIARDERILAASVCSPDFKTVAETPKFPKALACADLAPGLQPVGADATWQTWRGQRELPGGPVHVSAVPLLEAEQTVGWVVLIHDLSFVERREGRTQVFLLASFAMLALLASVITLATMRLSWRGWSDALRRLARGDTGERREFLPLLKDLRELIDRLATEEQAEMSGGAWTPERLKLTLNRHLHGEKLVVVAHREPFIHNRAPDGRIRVLHPASGLVSAIEPIMRACSGTWVAHGSGTADRETADAKGRLRVPPGEESYSVRRVWLSPEQEQGYYYGFANEGLWPLCHVAHNRPVFRAADWKQYQDVNRLFVNAVCEEVDTEDPVVLVQDYHFALAPRLLRERLPRATIITFWHIPWPNAEQIAICPWHVELMEGLLGSSILGFHTQFHCNNFMDSADRFLESRLDREDLAVVQGERRTLVRPYPISVEWPNHWVAAAPPVAECRAGVLRELGLPDHTVLGVGVERLDYTKGVEERLRAIERLLERSPELRGRFVFLQVSSPSRTRIERYNRLNLDVHALVEQINQRFATPSWKPIILHHQHTEPADVFRYYRAADLCYVSSLHDGMNLVAKEYVAARDDERGVLVLSQFAGASRELSEALVVNPYDIEEASAALATALAMPADEQRARMRAMRGLVAEYNVYRWAGRMLLDASRLRRREQLAGMLTDRAAAGARLSA